VEKSNDKSFLFSEKTRHGRLSKEMRGGKGVCRASSAAVAQLSSAAVAQLSSAGSPAIVKHDFLVKKTDSYLHFSENGV
jgi:hypothetical protein